MAAGDIINYTNIKSTLPTFWSYSPSWTDSSYDDPMTVYVSSTSFIVKIKATSVWLRASRVWLTGYYYSGTAWVEAYTGLAYSTNGGSDDSQYFYHNRADEGTTSADQHNHHLWKFVLKAQSPGSSHTYINFYIGGAEKMNETEYDSYLKGKTLQGVKPDYSSNGSYTDTTWVSSKYPSVYKGTPISIASSTYKYISHEE